VYAQARVLRCLELGSEVTPDEQRRIADESAAVFERLGDDRGLTLCWRLRGDASWLEGKAAGVETALAPALEHARRAGAHREETLIAYELSAALVQGPTPVLEAIQRCRDIIAAAPGDRGVEQAMSHALAHLHARLGQFELARPLAGRCREIAAESGERADVAGMTEIAWDVETLAGDHEAAEKIIAEGCDLYLAMGRPSPMLESFRALSQITRGRTVDIDRLTEISAKETGWIKANRLRVIALARVAAGDLDEAEAQARAAVDAFIATDFLTFHADALLTLGDVLRAAGRRPDADVAFQNALDLYRQKGSLVGERIAEARLAG
jgi:tetratricopeptide (TPR) repeat protein